MAEKDDFNELSLDELIERNKQVKELLAHLEDEYRSAAITENSYKQAKGSNTKKLEQIRKKLEEFGVKDDDAPPPSAPKADAKPPQSAVSSGLNAAANQAPVPTSPAPAAPAKNDSAPASTPASSASSSAPAQKSSFFSQLKSTISPDKGGAQSPQPSNAPPSSSAASASSSSFEPEIHRIDQKFSVELERIKTTLDAIKETKSATDERIQRMTESITELRSMIFQRETILKSYDIKIEKLGETMADIEPQKIIKEFNKRDKVAAEAEAKIEKLERKAEDMMKTINETNALMKSIGGLQNIAEVDHEIMKKVAHMQEMTTSVERFSEKTEKMFVEVNKKLEEFTVYKMRQENLEEVVRDLVKNSDRMGIKFENYLERKELDAFRNSTGNIEKQFELLKKSLKRAVPFIEAEIPKEMLDLQREKEDVELLISGITFEFQQKRMSEKDYLKALEKNRAKIAEIDAKLKDAIEKLGEEEKAKEEAKAAGKTAPQAKPQAQKAQNPAVAGTAQNPATQASPAKSGATAAATAPAKDAANAAKETAEAKAANADESESEESEGSDEGENSEESASDETGSEAEEEESSEEPASEEEQETPISKPAKKMPVPKHAVHHKSKKISVKNRNARKPKKAIHAKAAKAHAKHKTGHSPDTGMFNRLLRYNDADSDNKHQGKGGARGRNNMKPGAKMKRASGAADKSPALKMSDAGDYLEFKATHASHAFHKKKTAVKAKPKKSKVHKHKSAQEKIAGPKANAQKKSKQKKVTPQPKPKHAPAQVSKPAPKASVKSSAFGSLGSLGSSAAQKSPKPEPAKAEAKSAAAPKDSKDSNAEKSAGDDNGALIAELEDSYKQGLITKEAYQHTKKVLLGKNS